MDKMWLASVLATSQKINWPDHITEFDVYNFEPHVEINIFVGKMIKILNLIFLDKKEII